MQQDNAEMKPAVKQSTTYIMDAFREATARVQNFAAFYSLTEQKRLWEEITAEFGNVEAALDMLPKPDVGEE